MRRQVKLSQIHVVPYKPIRRPSISSTNIALGSLGALTAFGIGYLLYKNFPPEPDPNQLPSVPDFPPRLNQDSATEINRNPNHVIDLTELRWNNDITIPGTAVGRAIFGVPLRSDPVFTEATLDYAADNMYNWG